MSDTKKIASEIYADISQFLSVPFIDIQSIESHIELKLDFLVKDTEARTIQRCIERQCGYCQEENAKARNLNHHPYKSPAGQWIHDGLVKTDYWSIEFCNSANLHDLKQEQANGSH